MDSISTYMAAYQKASGTFVDADWTHEFLLSLDADPNDHGWDPDDGQDICDGTRPCQTCIDAAADAVACEEQAADAVAAADRGDWAAAISAAHEAAVIEDKWGDNPTWRPFVKAIALAATEALGRECATEVLDAGGSDPTDVDGRCLLPPDPVGGDWDALADLLGHEYSDEAETLFVEAYQTVMAPAIMKFLDELRDERDAENEERWQAIADAADDSGIVQAVVMVRLFPGQPTMHAATAGRDAMRAAGAPADFHPDGWSDPVGDGYDGNDYSAARHHSPKGGTRGHDVRQD